MLMESGDGEERWLQPSRRWLTLRVVEVAVTAIILMAVGAVIAVKLSSSWAVLSIPAAALVSVGLLIFELRRYKAWGYCERSSDLLVRRGIMVRRVTVVPYGRMQLVEATAGLPERAFGLSTIKLHTAAAATDAHIPGLDKIEATRLRDRLAALGEAQAAGV
jgi:membrane protein YdbS with pleckstrin-like domain